MPHSEASAALRRWGSLGNLGRRGFPRGRLHSLGTFSCSCPSGGRRAWDLCPLVVPARTGGNRGDHPELSLGPLGPPFHNMGLCGRPGGDPKAWKHFGPEPDPGMRALHKAPGRRGILEGGLLVRGGGRRPFGTLNGVTKLHFRVSIGPAGCRFGKVLLVTCSNRGVSISLGCSRRSGDPPVVYLISANSPVPISI